MININKYYIYTYLYINKFCPSEAEWLGGSGAPGGVHCSKATAGFIKP